MESSLLLSYLSQLVAGEDKYSESAVSHQQLLRACTNSYE